MLTKTDKEGIKHLLASPMGASLKLLIELYIRKLNDEPINTGDQWDTIKSALLREGKVQGIRDLYHEMVNQTQDV